MGYLAVGISRLLVFGYFVLKTFGVGKGIGVVDGVVGYLEGG